MHSFWKCSLRQGCKIADSFRSFYVRYRGYRNNCVQWWKICRQVRYGYRPVLCFIILRNFFMNNQCKMAVNVLLHAGVTLLYFSSLTQFVQPRPVPPLWKVSLHLISCAFYRTSCQLFVVLWIWSFQTRIIQILAKALWTNVKSAPNFFLSFFNK